MTSLKDKFQAAVEIVQNLPKDGAVSTTNEEKLIFYSLFKQSTVGPCTVQKPGFWNVVEKYKWEAWSSLDDLSANDAMTRYLVKLQRKIDEVNAVYDVEDWMAGSLYEKLKPLFDKIERPLQISQNQEDEEALSHSAEGKNEKSRSLEIINMASRSSIVSDSEYIDAVEEDVQTSRSRSSSYEIRDNVKIRSESVSSSRVEEQLQIIAERIDMLSECVERRSNHLMAMLKEATVYMFIPKKVSWALLMFLISWPFIAHILLRYIKRYFNLRF